MVKKKRPVIPTGPSAELDSRYRELFSDLYQIQLVWPAIVFCGRSAGGQLYRPPMISNRKVPAKFPLFPHKKPDYSDLRFCTDLELIEDVTIFQKETFA